MRRSMLAAVCLLAGAACAHSPQKPAPQQSGTPSTTEPNPGTMQMVPVSDRSEAKPADDMRSTAALPPQPIQSTEQPLNGAQPLSTGQAQLNAPTANDPVNVTAPPAADNRKAVDETVSAAASDTNKRNLTPAEIQLRERIQSTLASTSGLSYSARHVSIGVEKQDVTLMGDVRTAREKNEVQSLVQQVQGVRRVKNQLAVINATGLPSTDNAR